MTRRDLSLVVAVIVLAASSVFVMIELGITKSPTVRWITGYDITVPKR
jgi:hypothetical protein